MQESERLSVCPRRFEVTKALAAAFASKSPIPNGNVDKAAHMIVLLADKLVSKLEQLDAGMLEDLPRRDSYMELK